ncbi:MAG: mechanosensitive ion channel [Hydrogenophaga sp.]|nr:mechanosensitive ion channel [Hydrogenophaga sp.]
MIDHVLAAIPGHGDKLIATAILIAVGLVLFQRWLRCLARGEISAEKRRLHLAWARNRIWVVVLLTTVRVWAATIAGFALSLAAVAAALLIVSRELVMCVLGHIYGTRVQRFKAGDLIEFQFFRGSIVDADLFTSTLVEQDGAGTLTGKTVEFPNGLLPTRRMATGATRPWRTSARSPTRASSPTLQGAARSPGTSPTRCGRY